MKKLCVLLFLFATFAVAQNRVDKLYLTSATVDYKTFVNSQTDTSRTWIDYSGYDSVAIIIRATDSCRGYIYVVHGAGTIPASNTTANIALAYDQTSSVIDSLVNTGTTGYIKTIPFCKIKDVCGFAPYQFKVVIAWQTTGNGTTSAKYYEWTKKYRD
jgi:hypothetical protein